MSVLQIEGFDSFSASPAANTLKTKLMVTNPTGAFNIGGSGKLFAAGRNPAGKSFQGPNQTGSPMWWSFHPKFRAGGTLNNPMIFGFAMYLDDRDGAWYVPILRVLTDAGQGMEFSFRVDNSPDEHWFEIHRGFDNRTSDAGGPTTPVRNPGGSGSTILASTAKNLFATKTWVYVEFRFFCADSGGLGEIRINGISRATFSGDTMKDSGNANSVEITMGHLGISGLRYDDIYILDEDGIGRNTYLGDVFVETIRPNADGNQNDWTRSSGSNNYEMVDEVDFDGDGTYVSTNTVADVELYDFENLSLITTETILAVQVSTADRNEAVGTNNLEHMYRAITPAEFQGTKQGLVQDTAWEGHYQIWEKDPNTGFNWSVAALNSGQFGMKLIS